MLGLGFKLGIYAQVLKRIKTGILSLLTPSTVIIYPGIIPTPNYGAYITAISSNDLLLYFIPYSGDTAKAFDRVNSTGLLTPQTIPTVPMSGSFKAHYSGNYICTSHENLNTITFYDILNGCTLTSTTASGVGPVGVAIKPNGGFLYVANKGDNTITHYSLPNPPVPTLISTTNTIRTPYNLAISPDGTSLYVRNYSSAIVDHYAIDTTTGNLTFIDTVTTTTSTYGGIVVSPDNTSVYVGNNNSLYQFSRDLVSGVLTPLTIPMVSVVGSIWDIKLSTDGKSLYCVSSYGVSSKVYQFSRNTITGELTALSPTYVKAVSSIAGFMDIVLSSDNKTLYSGDGSCYSRDIFTGKLRPLPGSISSKPNDLTISPDGKSLYVCDGANDNVAQFTVDTITGLVTPLIPTTVVTTGINPQAIASSPDGKNIYTTNMDSNSISTFNRNTTTGLLLSTKLSENTTINNFTAVSTVISPNNKFLYSIKYLSNLLYQYSRDIFTGDLLALNPASITTTNGTARDLVQSTDGKHLYTLTKDASSVFYITHFRVNTATGLASLDPIENTTIGNYVAAFNLIISPDNKFMYVLLKTTTTYLAAFNIDPSTGVLTFNTLLEITSGTTPYSAALSPDGKHIYVVSSASIGMYAVDTTVGKTSYILSLIGTVASGGWALFITFVNNGLNLYITNYGGLILPYWQRDSNTGLLTRIASNIELPYQIGSLSFNTIAVGSTEEILYITSSTTNNFFNFNRNPSTGVLNLINTIVTNTSSTTGALVKSPDNKFLYCIGNKYKVLTIDPVTKLATGASTTPVLVSSGIMPKNIIIHPNNNFAYVANYGDNTLTQYSRNTNTGLLTLIGTIATWSSPLGLAISPDGLHLYVGNYSSSNISYYLINTTTGLLTSLGTINTASTSPIEISISPNGLFVCVTNPLSNTFNTFSRDTSTGILTVISPIVSSVEATGVDISTDGLNAYVTNKISNVISEYSVDYVNKKLVPLSTPTITTVDTKPTSIVISPNDNYVYVVNSEGSSISQYLKS